MFVSDVYDTLYVCLYESDVFMIVSMYVKCTFVSYEYIYVYYICMFLSL